MDRDRGASQDRVRPASPSRSGRCEADRRREQFQTVRELCPQSTVLEGFIIRGGLERDGQYLVIKGARAEEAQKEVESWLRKIKVLQ